MVAGSPFQRRRPKTLLILNQLTGYGVKYRSLQEQWIDSLGAFSDAIIGILATVAKFEADRMSNRVRSGLARARAEGKVLGRPRSIVDRGKLAAMREEGDVLREIAGDGKERHDDSAVAEKRRSGLMENIVDAYEGLHLFNDALYKATLYLEAIAKSGPFEKIVFGLLPYFDLPSSICDKFVSRSGAIQEVERQHSQAGVERKGRS